MSIHLRFVLWYPSINYAIPILWLVLVSLAHDLSYRFSNKFLPIPVEDCLHYAGIIFYKILIICLSYFLRCLWMLRLIAFDP